MAVSEPGDAKRNDLSADLPLLPNGGIDLYALLHVPENASTSALRARIGELYSATLANTEHKDLRKRHYYENLLDLLPRCHEILLNDERRQLYDGYLAASRAGQQVPEFADFLRQTADEVAARAREREGLLEIRHEPPLLAPPTISEADTAEGQQVGPVAAAIGVAAGLAALIILRGVLRFPLTTAIALGLVAAGAGAALAFVALSRKRG